MMRLNHKEREHAILSASSAHRWLACPPSAVIATTYPEQDTEFTREGTLAHEVAEIYASGKTLNTGPWPDGIDKEMLECARNYRDYIQELTQTDDAVMLLEKRVDFSRWVPGGFGTCDCIILQGNTMDVVDYKYGKGVQVNALGNPQMMLYALGALNDYGFLYEVRRVRMHVYQPRIDNISTAEISVEELLSWAEETVRPRAELADRGTGEYKEGDHCRFCPHAGRCRALATACREFAEARTRIVVQELTPHEVAEVLALEPMIAMWLKRVRAQALTNLLDGQEVPGFKVVAGKEGNRKWSDELKVVEALRCAGYADNEFLETKLMSPAGLDKALGKKTVADLLGGLTVRAPGAPTVVPASDKRPAYDRLAEAKKDFEEE